MTGVQNMVGGANVTGAYYSTVVRGLIMYTVTRFQTYGMVGLEKAVTIKCTRVRVGLSVTLWLSRE